MLFLVVRTWRFEESIFILDFTIKRNPIAKKNTNGRARKILINFNTPIRDDGGAMVVLWGDQNKIPLRFLEEIRHFFSPWRCQKLVLRGRVRGTTPVTIARGQLNFKSQLKFNCFWADQDFSWIKCGNSRFAKALSHFLTSMHGKRFSCRPIF